MKKESKAEGGRESSIPLGDIIKIIKKKRWTKRKKKGDFSLY